MSDVLDAAIEYAESGLRVLPLWGVRPDGSCQCPAGAGCSSAGKHPHSRLVPRGVLDASDDVARVRSWWRQAPGSGVAIATGGAIFAVDVDLPDGPASLDRLVAGREWPESSVVLTGGGGFHYYWGKDDDVRARCAQALAGLPGLDVRGEGGYLVAPPTTHRSGARYSWGAGLERLAAAPAWLLEAVAGEPRDPPGPARVVATRDVDAAEVEQIRAALAVIPPNEGRETWIERVSMPIHDRFGGSDVGFEVWHEWCARGDGLTTPSGNPAYGGIEECRRVWRSFSARHRNPKGIATLWAHARAHGWAPPTTTAPAPVNGNGNGHARDDDAELAPWREPEPLWRPEPAPRLEFAAAYPGSLAWLRDLVVAIGDLQQVDPAFPALLSLGMAAGAAGRSFSVRIDGTGWVEPMALWVICALESGAGKSPVFRPLVRPFHAWEREVDGEQRRAEAEWEARVDAERAMVASAQQALRKRATADAESREGLRRALVDARRRLADVEHDRPQSRKIVASSLTTPALVEFLMRHQERCLIVDPEGSVFQHALGGKTDAEKDLDPWLKAYSCEPIRQNRVGDRRHGGPVERYVASPALSMALCTQTGALDLFRDRYAESRGFLARFVAATFDHALPERALPMGELPAHLEARWSNTIHALLARPVPREPVELLLAGDCAGMFVDWCQRWLDEARVDPQADLGSPVGYGTPAGAKVRSTALRIILLLHVLEDPATATERPISTTTVRSVLDGWMPFVRRALARTLVVIRDDPAGRIADRVLAHIWRHRVAEFSRAEVKSHLSDGRVTRVDDLNPALSALSDAGWIQPLERIRIRGPGTVPAASRYAVHPGFREHYRAT